MQVSRRIDLVVDGHCRGAGIMLGHGAQHLAPGRGRRRRGLICAGRRRRDGAIRDARAVRPLAGAASCHRGTKPHQRQLYSILSFPTGFAKSMSCSAASRDREPHLLSCLRRRRHHLPGTRPAGHDAAIVIASGQAGTVLAAGRARGWASQHRASARLLLIAARHAVLGPDAAAAMA